MSISELIRWAKEQLKDKPIETLEIQCLLAKVLKKNRVYILTYPEQLVLDENKETFINWINRLKEGEPFHYLMGNKEWMGFDFIVSEATLIPREDTRILLEGILSLKEKIDHHRLAEIGTGSGILPVLIKKNWPESIIHTVEINPETLKIARENFRQHEVQIHSYLGDFIEPLVEDNVKVDVLFSNPPYISEDEYNTLDEYVKKEPYGALVGGLDGLDYYRRLANEYKKILVAGGYLLVEIGWLQKKSVEDIFIEAGLVPIDVLKDDGQRDRVIIMQRNKDEDTVL